MIITWEECGTQVFLLSVNKDLNLPFGRSSKWEVAGGDAELEDGKIVISHLGGNDAELSFSCFSTACATNNNP